MHADEKPGLQHGNAPHHAYVLKEGKKEILGIPTISMQRKLHPQSHGMFLRCYTIGLCVSDSGTKKKSKKCLGYNYKHLF